jgi:hypothetical protein
VRFEAIDPAKALREAITEIKGEEATITVRNAEGKERTLAIRKF